MAADSLSSQVYLQALLGKFTAENVRCLRAQTCIVPGKQDDRWQPFLLATCCDVAEGSSSQTPLFLAYRHCPHVAVLSSCEDNPRQLQKPRTKHARTDTLPWRPCFRLGDGYIWVRK
jgi:hypothetical protein